MEGLCVVQWASNCCSLYVLLWLFSHSDSGGEGVAVMARS